MWGRAVIIHGGLLGTVNRRCSAGFTLGDYSAGLRAFDRERPHSDAGLHQDVTI